MTYSKELSWYSSGKKEENVKDTVSEQRVIWLIQTEYLPISTLPLNKRHLCLCLKGT
jgi:hypothetical protein